MTKTLTAPYPFFGGKRDAAPHVWAALGHDVTNYVEPFFGSGAVLLGRPGGAGRVETINDKDGYVSNVWRALRAAPEQVAEHADWPVNEADLVARHLWLVGEREVLTQKLMANPRFFDAQAAGWWVWGASMWIGSGWCAGTGGWSIADDGEQLVETPRRGVERKRPNLHDQGKGSQKPTVSRKMPKGDHQGAGIHRPSVWKQHPHLSSEGLYVHGEAASGRGVHRQAADLSGEGRGALVVPPPSGLRAWFETLAARLRHVRVCCGDWRRVVGPSSTWKNLTVVSYSGNGTCGIFLDPPYSGAVRKKGLYAVDDHGVAAEVRAWCLKNGNNPKLRIVLAGYEGEGHEVLEGRGWRVAEWAPGGFFRGGYGNQRQASQRHRERLWLSPHCLEAPTQLNLGFETEVVS